MPVVAETSTCTPAIVHLLCAPTVRALISRDVKLELMVVKQLQQGYLSAGRK